MVEEIPSEGGKEKGDPNQGERNVFFPQKPSKKTRP